MEKLTQIWKFLTNKLKLCASVCCHLERCLCPPRAKHAGVRIQQANLREDHNIYVYIYVYIHIHICIYVCIYVYICM